MRSLRLWFPREETLTWADYGIVQVDYWLRSRVETPDFWKRNCTHSPASIVMGIALAILTGIGGLLMRFQRQGRSLAIFSAFGLALALLFYALVRCMLHGRPDDHVLRAGHGPDRLRHHRLCKCVAARRTPGPGTMNEAGTS